MVKLGMDITKMEIRGCLGSLAVTVAMSLPRAKHAAQFLA